MPNPRYTKRHVRRERGSLRPAFLSQKSVQFLDARFEAAPFFRSHVLPHPLEPERVLFLEGADVANKLPRPVSARGFRAPDDLAIVLPETSPKIDRDSHVGPLSAARLYQITLVFHFILAI